MKSSPVNDFLDFIRIRICIYAIFLSMIGYLIFNHHIQSNLFFVLLSAFFGTGAAYAYNNKKDVEEDKINRKMISTFTSKNAGYLVISTFLLFSVICASIVSIYTLIFISTAIAAGISYSSLRLKKYPLLKNVYTAFGSTPVFLMGASAGGLVTSQIFLYYLFFSFFIFISSIVSDMRDYKGDVISEIRTIPVKIGYEKSRRIAQLLLMAFSILPIIFTELLMLLPFAILMIFSLQKDNPSRAHSLSGYSFFFLTIWLSVL